MANFKIGSYTITNTSMSNGYGWIMLFSADGGTVNRARLNFVTTGVGNINVNPSMITVQMHVNSFDRVIDTLRNEKPVKFSWYPSWAGIYTGKEPVGEEEA